jgi:hypothetical protein
MANILSFFPCDGYWYSVDSALARSSGSEPRLVPIFGLVDLIPRVPKGFTVRVKELDQSNDPAGTGTVMDTDVAIPARTGRLWNGRLCTINAVDSPTVELLSETAVLNLTPDVLPDTNGRLIYDVRFRDVTYNGVPQHISGFGFYASQSAAAISLTAFELERLPYGGPNEAAVASVIQAGGGVVRPHGRHLTLVEAKERGVA